LVTTRWAERAAALGARGTLLVSALATIALGLITAAVLTTRRRPRPRPRPSH
jgi:hypothetical protein